MWYRIAADLVLVVHLLFIGFVVGGSFLAWRWPRFVRVHLPTMVYGALVEFIGFPCPLPALPHYLIQVIYPPGLTRGIQIGLGLIVVLIAAAGYGGYLRRRGPARGWRTEQRARRTGPRNGSMPRDAGRGCQ